MEGSCSGTSERSWPKDEFTDLLYQVENIPEVFESGSVWEALVSDAKNHKSLFNADEDREIDKAIIDVKKELDQLDDLLSGESTLFQNLRWQVLFSDNFRKSFQKLRFSSTKKLVITLLLKLARGWRPRKVNVDRKCENSSYIIKQFKVEIYHVVCSVDLMKDSIYKHVLKVWDILPMTDTTKLLKRIDSIASMYSDDFINHCNNKLLERNLEVPLSWSLSSDIFRFKNPSNTKLDSGANTSSVECRTYVENSKVSESLLLMKFHSLSSGTVNHLLCDVEGKSVDLPFEVTDEEREIIHFTRSSFILGRSGTGKTTILTMKLYQTFQQYCIASRDTDDIGSITDEVDVDDNVSITDEVNVEQCHGGSKGPVLHQLFVTVSPKLCHAVKKNVAQMKRISTENYSGEDNFTGMDEVDEVSEFKDIPDTFVGVRQDKYPLIITFHKFLMMLDGTLGKSYFQRFPYVRDSSHFEGRRSVSLQTFLRKNEVTYDRFSSKYWPHFNAKLTKSLDAPRVFIEIMSHIKGGPLEGEAWDYKRSRHDYISLSESRRSTLCVEQRCAIYDIFEDYEKMKLELNEFDLADFVNDIHLRLNKEDFPGDKMDFVYIDEVQDLTIRQISLFKYICNNVDEGFTFSGDTAQTISRGIDFRFEDIRSLFYNEFLMRSQNCGFSGKKEKGLISDMFNLSYNFRTHTGVLRLAQSVVDLISYYFPHSIDVLAPETSHIHIYGESPIFLEPGSDENSIISIFGNSGKSSGKRVGFGADQVILVRDDSAKKEISNYTGHQALILTIVECKGLEFEDVLLYNFFGSSPLSKQWRVVYEFLNEKGLLDGDSTKCFPTFSQSKHNLLCSELKQLYVMITRTRQRLWICENNIEVSKPMLDYWGRFSLVQMAKIDDTLAEAMHKASTPEEWKSQGIKLFWEMNYEMAAMCFEKAGDETWEKRAKASGLRAAADSLSSSNSEEAAIMLREAAEIFDSIDIVESAAECFFELGEYERAGKIYRDKCSKSELRKAGECFSLAGKHELAAEVYESGNLFRDCLSACTKGNHVDLGLHYIEKWKLQALSNREIMAGLIEIDRIVQEFLKKCGLECHKAKDNSSLMKFVRAFCSTESKRNFLKSLDCLEELLVLEEELGNFNEASKIANSLGDTLREVDLLEKAGQFSSACSLIFSYVISNVLWGSGNRGWPLKSFPQKVELLNRVMSIAQKVSDTFHASICARTKFLLYDQKNLSELMQFYNASKQYKSPICEILVVRKLLDVHCEVNATKYEWDDDLQLDPRKFNQRIAMNQVSSGALFYLWNLWKTHSLEILECLDSLERTDSIKLEGVVGFCFDYFGLRLPDNSSVTFHLLNPDAAWVKNVEGFIRRNRKVATLEVQYFASAARKFWLQELLLVGLRVLDVIQKLHRSSIAKNLSVRYHKSMCLLHIFDIAKFLLDFKSIDMKYTDNRKLQDFVQLSMEYLLFVFNMDPRASLFEKMIYLRETELSRNLLEECVLRNIGGTGELSGDQIGLVVMTMLGCGRMKLGFYDKIAERLPNNAPWKPFIETLREIVESDSVKESKFDTVSVCRQDSPLICSTEALSEALYKGLIGTWVTRIAMCPPRLLYLVERLLILAPHPQAFFFTTKSSFVEYILSLPSDANPSTGLVAHNISRPLLMVVFVRVVVEQILDNIFHKEKWFKIYGINYNSYNPVFVLRLFMIMCMLCINWDLRFDVIDQKLARAEIKSQLPREFCKALRPRRRGYNSFVSAVATAFKLISDPLVIVVSGDTNNEFPYPDAVFLDLRSISSKTDIMKTLFPRSTEASHDQPTVVNNDGKNIIVESSEITASNSSSENGNENENGNLKINWDLIGDIIIEVFERQRDRNSEDLGLLLLLRKQEEVREHLELITSAITRLSEERSHSANDKDFPYDANHLTEDLNTLLSLFHRSEYESKAMSEICKLFKSMEARRPQIDALVSLVMGKSPDADAVADSNLDNEDCKTEAVEVEPNPSSSNKGGVAAAACSQGKGKNKKKNKPKKGKGGKNK